MQVLFVAAYIINKLKIDDIKNFVQMPSLT